MRAPFLDERLAGSAPQLSPGTGMSLLRAYVPSDALVASAVPDVEVRPYSRVSEVLDADRIDVLVLPHPLTPDDRSAAAELRNTRVVQSLTSGVDHLEGVLLLASNVRLVGAPCLHAGPTAEQALTLIVSMLTLPLVLQSHFVVVLLSSLVVGFRARY